MCSTVESEGEKRFLLIGDFVKEEYLLPPWLTESQRSKNFLHY
jgi:hypothetical protein